MIGSGGSNLGRLGKPEPQGGAGDEAAERLLIAVGKQNGHLRVHSPHPPAVTPGHLAPLGLGLPHVIPEPIEGQPLPEAVHLCGQTSGKGASGGQTTGPAHAEVMAPPETSSS